MSTKHQRRFLGAFCGALLCALSSAAQTFPVSTSFFGSVTWTNTTGNRLQIVRVVESLTAAQVNTGRIYTLSTTATNLVAEKADAAFRTLLWPSATGTVYIYAGDRIRATVSTTNRAFLTIDALAVDANVITNITETDPVWSAFRTGATAVAIGAATDAGAGGVALGWQATGYNNGAAVGVLADAAGGQAAALGREANANNSGAAVGYQALGGNSGVAVGNGARGRYAGVAVGYGAKGTNFGTAIGYTAEAAGIGNAALGGSDVSTNRAYVPPTMTDTVELGRGTAISNGWLHWRGVPIADAAGRLWSQGRAAGSLTNVSVGGTSNFPVSVVFHPGTGITLQASSSGIVVHASASSGVGGDLTTLSNWVKAISPLASNAVPSTGGVYQAETNSTPSFPSPVSGGWTFKGRDYEFDATSLLTWEGASVSIGPGNSEYNDGGGWLRLYAGSGPIYGEIETRGRINGNGSGLTNLNASALSSGTIPAGILGTNITRTVGGIVTTGGVSAASFYGNGGSLTNVPWIYPWTQFYYHVNTDYTNWLRIAVASNEYTSAIEVCGVWQQTNDAASTYLYVRLNGLTGTNVMYSQGYTINTGAAAPTSAQASNDAPGWTACRFYCPANSTNAVADWSVKIKNIHGFTKTMSGRCFSKPRAGGGYLNQFQEFYDGDVQFAGSVTQIEIFVWNATKPNTGSVTRAMNLPQ